MTNTYFQLKMEDGSEELKEYLQKPDTICYVCALGALLVAEILHTDDLTYDRLKYDVARVTKSRLSLYFDKPQIGLIESVFERNPSFAHLITKDMDATDAITYKNHVLKAVNSTKDASTIVRMRMIMQNIIDNDGEFKVT